PAAADRRRPVRRPARPGPHQGHGAVSADPTGRRPARPGLAELRLLLRHSAERARGALAGARRGLDHLSRATARASPPGTDRARRVERLRAGQRVRRPARLVRRVRLAPPAPARCPRGTPAPRACRALPRWSGAAGRLLTIDTDPGEPAEPGRVEQFR